MKYERHPLGKAILAQGESGSKFYVILTGSVGVIKHVDVEDAAESKRLAAVAAARVATGLKTELAKINVVRTQEQSVTPLHISHPSPPV